MKNAPSFAYAINSFIVDYSKRTAQVSGRMKIQDSALASRAVASVTFGQIVFAEGLLKQTVVDFTEGDG